MELVLHPKVYSDIDQIMACYEHVATGSLPMLLKEEIMKVAFALTTN